MNKKPTNTNEELDRLEARMVSIEQKCDLILSQLSGLRVREGIDELINRLHETAKSMRN